MILQVVITALLILVMLALYKVWIKPARTIRSYSKQLRDLGYKVYETPYNPFKSHLLDTINKGIKQGDALKICKQDYSKYDVVVTNMLTDPKLQFSHLEFLKDFYSVDKHYEYPKEKRITDIYTRLAGDGLPFSEGHRWKRKRTILNKIFNFDFVKAQAPTIARICSDQILEIEQESKRNEEENSVQYNVIDLTTMMFSGVMMEIFLGGTQNQLINGEHVGKFLKKLFGDLGQQSLNPLNFLLGTKFVRLGITQSQRDIENRVQAYRKWGVDFIKRRISEINAELEKNKQKKIPSDIIEAIIMERRNAGNGNSSEQMIQKEEEIFEEFNAFFVAGTDTTSNFTQMMIYEIARHPQIEAKVREEIDTYMKEENYEYENLKNFKYIQMLQKETTRCYGPGTHIFARKASVDNYLNGLPVRKGTVVSLQIIGNHFSQKHFKNPKQFRPERWESECDDLPQFLFGGFSAGARTCIGKHLAMLESKIAIIKFMKRYSKIILPNNNFKMAWKFLYSPEDFETKLIISP